MIFETLAIGDELLSGKTTDTNSTFIARELFSLGHTLARTTVIPDVGETIVTTLKEIQARGAQYAFVFGGLGPTSDDLTAEAVASHTGLGLQCFIPAQRKIVEFIRARNRPLTEQLYKQTWVPSMAEALPNPVGHAPGFTLKFGATRVFFFPGVPREMKAIWKESVLPWIQRELPESAAKQTQVWKVIGLPESELQRHVDPWEKKFAGKFRFSYRSVSPENHLTLLGKGTDFLTESEELKRMDEVLARWTYSRGPETLEETVARLLKQNGLCIATVESCTAGLVVQRLTRFSGSSSEVWGGFACYQVAFKEAVLGVKLAKPEDAVSPECSRSLAESVYRWNPKAVVASVTGYLPPAPDVDTQKLNWIHICVRSGDERTERSMRCSGEAREEAQWNASSYVLHTVLEHLKNKKV